MECMLCSKVFNTDKGLSSHVVNHHNYQSFREYYDEFIKTIDEGVCKLCKKPTSYVRRPNKRYRDYCSHKCHINDNKDVILSGIIKYNNEIKGKTFDEIHGAGSAKKLSNKMMGVFTEEWFINKHGETVGKDMYISRCNNIKKTTYFTEYNKINMNNYSKVSQKLFHELCLVLPDLLTDGVYFAELNHEYSCGIESCNYDFVVIDRKKIIEFNGDKWHANPKLYGPDDRPNPRDKSLTSLDIWKKDKTKITNAEQKGYDVLIVWESDYISDKNMIIQECVNFLKN
jgi:hypothetical protein